MLINTLLHMAMSVDAKKNVIRGYIERKLLEQC
jgi:hypothetical protein